MDRHASVLSNSNSSKKSGNSRNSASPSGSTFKNFLIQFLTFIFSGEEKD